MRYALVSDIHSNLEAFKAVLAEIKKDKVDKYLCLGDVVGYGADPHECIKLLQSLKPEVILAGNHEWGVLGLTDIEYFNEAAREAVTWTYEVLSQEEKTYMGSFKLVHETKGFILVHGALYQPDEFNYILNDYDAYRNMKMMNVPLCFVGHSHVGGIFHSEERVEFTPGPMINIEKGKKYVINVGSVGQPRDLNPKAAYAIYDDAAHTVEIKRVEYDIKAAQEKILKAGLPTILATRLSQGR